MVKKGSLWQISDKVCSCWVLHARMRLECRYADIAARTLLRHLWDLLVRVVGLSRPCRGEVVPSPCAAGLGLIFPYPQHILYFSRPRVLRSYSTVHVVLEHFRIVVCAVTPKLPMHETIASIPRKAEVVPIPVCPSGNAVKTATPCHMGYVLRWLVWGVPLGKDEAEFQKTIGATYNLSRCVAVPEETFLASEP